VASGKKEIIKESSCQRHISWFGELEVGGVKAEFFFYKDWNQTEIFIGMKTENNIYYRGEKRY